MTGVNLSTYLRPSKLPISFLVVLSTLLPPALPAELSLNNTHTAPATLQPDKIQTQTLKWHSLLTEIQKKSRRSSHFFVPPLAGGLSAVLSLPPDPNGGMPAVLRISSPGPCFCRSICLASFNSRVNPQVTKTHWIDMIPFGVQLFLPRAPNLFFHFGELSVGAVRRGERRFGLVSSQSVSTAAAGCLFAPRSIQPHWFRGRKRVALSYL